LSFDMAGSEDSWSILADALSARWTGNAPAFETRGSDC